MVLFAGASEQPGHEAVLHLWAREQPLHCGRRDVNLFKRTAGASLRGRAGRVGQPEGDHPGRIVCTSAAEAHLRRRAHGLRFLKGRAVGPGHRGGHRDEQADRRDRLDFET